MHKELVGRWGNVKIDEDLKFKDLRPGNQRYINKDLDKILNNLNIKKKYKNIQFKKLDEALKYYNKSFLFTGNTGTGKTYLSYCILKFAYIKNYAECLDGPVRLKKNIFVTATDLFIKLRNSFKDGSEESELDIIKKHSNCNLLIIDDLGSSRISEYVLEALYAIINHRYEDEKVTIITTNLDMGELEEVLGERMISRLKSMCEIKKFKGKDKR